MNRVIVFGIATLTLCVGAVNRSNANLMTFDSLAADFSSITTFTEDSITLYATDGGGEHFHTVTNPNNGTTGAQLYSSDGTPHRIIFNGGADAFSLTSLDVFDIDSGSGPISFTSSSGGLLLVGATGPVVFGAGFQSVNWVQIDIPDPDSDRFISIDNILTAVAAVPEPASMTLIGLGAVGMAFGAYRRRRQQKAAV